MEHEGQFIEKTHFLETSDGQSRIFQSVQEVEHRLVWHRNILELFIILRARAAFLLRLSQSLVDVGESAMHLELSVAAVIVDIGLEHVVLEIIRDIAQTTIKHDTTIDILINDMIAEVAQTYLSSRNKSMKIVVPYHFQVRDHNRITIKIR